MAECKVCKIGNEQCRCKGYPRVAVYCHRCDLPRLVEITPGRFEKPRSGYACECSDGVSDLPGCVVGFCIIVGGGCCAAIGLTQLVAAFLPF